MAPKFDGSFVGQRWTRAGQQRQKRVSWIDRLTGEKRFGRILGRPEQTDEMVWDGKKWVPASEYKVNSL